MTDIDERVISNLLAVMRGLEKPLVKHVSADGLTATQFAVMEMLFHKGERIVNDIIDGVFSTSRNISVVIDNLIKAKLLNKKVNPNDGRSRLIYLTKAGKEKIAAYYPNHKKELRYLMKGVTVSEKEQLISALQTLSHCIEKIAPKTKRPYANTRALKVANPTSNELSYQVNYNG